MTYKEVTPATFGNTKKFSEQGQVVEGKLLEVREDVGKNGSNVYVIETAAGKEEYWGANALDPLLENVPTGSKVKVTLLDTAHKFPNGRVGKNFKVEVDS